MEHLRKNCKTFIYHRYFWLILIVMFTKWTKSYTSGVAWTALTLRMQLWRCVGSSDVAWAALVGVTVGVTVGITRWASRGGSLCRGSPQHFHGALCAWPCPWHTQGHRHTGSCPTAVSLGDGTVDRCWVGGTAMNQIWANVWGRSSGALPFKSIVNRSHRNVHQMNQICPIRILNRSFSEHPERFWKFWADSSKT